MCANNHNLRTAELVADGVQVCEFSLQCEEHIRSAAMHVSGQSKPATKGRKLRGFKTGHYWQSIAASTPTAPTHIRQIAYGNPSECGSNVDSPTKTVVHPNRPRHSGTGLGAGHPLK
jgi:hypothetical protein